MATKSNVLISSQAIAKASWLPIHIIELAQIQMGFNVSAIL
jgi:hypothetical protein